MTFASAPLVWLFDVDGTLLLTAGAGKEAMRLALRDVFAIEDDLSGVAFAGRTDLLITRDIFRAHDLTPDPDGVAAWWERVVANMRALMTPPRGGLLAGVPALLDRLDADAGSVPALLTGNVTAMARLKLGAFDAWHRFAFGAFGEEGEDRDALARLAVRRASERHGVGPERCIVVGDTEHDVACARAAGARAVAVATGSRTREQLAQCRPDLLLDDLTEAERLLGWARERVARRDQPFGL